MNLRSTYILLGFVGVALLALGASLLYRPDPAAYVGYLFPAFHDKEIKPGDVTAVEYQRGAEKLVFARTPQQTWKLVSPGESQLDQRAVADLVRDLLEARTVPAGGNSPKTLTAAGLDNPAVKITLKKGIEQESTLSIGSADFGEDGLVSCRIAEYPDSILRVKRSALRSLFKPGVAKGTTAEQAKTLSDFRSLLIARSGISDPLTQINRVSLKSGVASLAVEKGADKGWKFLAPASFGQAEVEPPAAGVPGEVRSVRQLLEQLTNVQAASGADFIDAADGLGEYGLADDSPNTLVAEWDFDPAGGGPVQTTKLVAGKEVEGKSDQVYVRINDGGPVIKVSGVPIRALRAALAKPQSLRDRTIAFLPANRADAIHIYALGALVELSARDVANTDWRVNGAEAGKTSKASKAAVDSLLAVVTQPRLALDFPAANLNDAAMGFDKPQAAVFVWADAFSPGAAADAKPPATPTLRITFGKSEAGGVIARVTQDGTTHDFIVPASLLAAVNRPRLAYLEAVPTALKLDEITKLSFNRGGENYAFEKPGGAGTSGWNTLSPEAKKGQAADESKLVSILSQLSTLKPAKIVEEAPSAAELSRLKLDPKSPFVVVTVTPAKGESRIYRFGSPVRGESKNVYATLPGLDLIVEVPKAVMDATQEGELVPAAKAVEKK